MQHKQTTQTANNKQSKSNRQGILSNHDKQAFAKKKTTSQETKQVNKQGSNKQREYTNQPNKKHAECKQQRRTKQATTPPETNKRLKTHNQVQKSNN